MSGLTRDKGLDLTAAALKAAKFRGPVAFYDGRNGMARQDFQCVDEPRFGYFWRRENRSDGGRQAYMVDGKEVADLDEACRLLALPPDPDSPAEIYKREIDEFKFSPSLTYGATRALSEARCNADGGPYGMIRAWLQRSEHAWHVGINAFADIERNAQRQWPSWLYLVKSAAQETYRAMYLFAGDRQAESGLQCAFGMRCRDCPILLNVEASMVTARNRVRFPSDIDAADIDAAKVWTCIGHILTGKPYVTDGAFFSTKAEREDTRP